MNIFKKLPSVILDRIKWLASGPPNLDIYNKKNQISEELKHYRLIRTQFDKDKLWHLAGCVKYGMDGIYLNRITDYSKTPELKNISYMYSHNDCTNSRKLRAYFNNLRLYTTVTLIDNI